MENLPNLLIVDDSNDQLTYFDTVLRKLKVNLIKADSGLAALEKTRGLELALAIIDVRMPVMNGYELALKMQEERSGEKVPIIFLTASHVNEVQVFEGYSTGAVDYIFKPLNISILLCKVNVFLDLFNQKQTILGHVAKLRDYTDELKMANVAIKKNEEKYRMLFNANNDSISIFTIGPNGNPSDFIESNDAATELFGYTKEELMLLNYKDLEEKIPEKITKYRLETLRSNGRVDFETIIKNKEGNIRNLEVKMILINYQDQPAIMNISRDITERKRAEITLKKKSDELAHFNKLMVGREVKMIELKKEINVFLKKAGEKEKYIIHK